MSFRKDQERKKKEEMKAEKFVTMTQTAAAAERKHAVTRKRITVDDNFVDSANYISKRHDKGFRRVVEEKNDTGNMDDNVGIQCRLQDLIVTANEERVQRFRLTSSPKDAMMPSLSSSSSPSQQKAPSPLTVRYSDPALAVPLKAFVRFSSDDWLSKEVWYKASDPSSLASSSAESIPLPISRHFPTDGEPSTIAATVNVLPTGQVGPLFAKNNPSVGDGGNGKVSDEGSDTKIATQINPFDPLCEGIRIPIFGEFTDLPRVAAILQTKLLLGFSPDGGNSCLPAQVVVTSSPETLCAYEASVLVSFNEERYASLVADSHYGAPNTIDAQNKQKKAAFKAAMLRSIQALKGLGETLYVGDGKSVLLGEPQIVRFASVRRDVVVADEAKPNTCVGGEEQQPTPQKDVPSEEGNPQSENAPVADAVPATTAASSLSESEENTTTVEGTAVDSNATTAKNETSPSLCTTHQVLTTPLFDPSVLPDTEHTLILRGVMGSMGGIIDRLEMVDTYGFVNYTDSLRHSHHLIKSFKQSHRLLERDFDGFLRVHLSMLTVGFAPLLHELKDALKNLDADFGAEGGGGGGDGYGLSPDGTFANGLNKDAARRRHFNPWGYVEKRLSPHAQEVVNWLNGEMKHLGLPASHPKQLLEILTFAAGMAESGHKDRFRRTKGNSHIANAKALDPAGIIRECIHRHALLDTVAAMSDVHWNSLASLRLKVLGPEVVVGDIVVAKSNSERNSLLRFDTGSTDISRDVMPTAEDVYMPRWAQFIGSEMARGGERVLMLNTNANPQINTIKGGGSGADAANSALLLPTSFAEYHESLFTRGILKIVESKTEAAQYALSDVVLPKLGRGGNSRSNSNNRNTVLDTTPSHLPSRVLEASGVRFPTHRISKRAFDELGQRLKVSQAAHVKMAPWATYRRLVERPLVMPSSSAATSSPSSSSSSSSRIHYAIWNDSRGMLDDPFNLLSSSTTTDKEMLRRLRHPLRGDNPHIVRKAISNHETRGELLSNVNDKMSVMIKCRLRRGVSMNSLLREPFAARPINGERLWGMGVGVKAIVDAAKKGASSSSFRKGPSQFKRFLTGKK